MSQPPTDDFETDIPLGDEPHSLQADKPLTDPTHDLLNYDSFATMLAKSIEAMMPPEGLVMAIYGPWGAGKTTLVEFTLHHLEKLAIEDRPIIVRFNPWWFSGHENLIRIFFEQVQISLRNKLEQRVYAGLDLMRELGRIVSKTPIRPIRVTGTIAGNLPAVTDDVVAIKKQIADRLRKQKQRILVVIDDIDRLMGEEIRQLFTAIKAIADFPNVIYLLAFDRDIVLNSLGTALGYPADEYLEKIVEVGFALPLTDHAEMLRLMSEQVDKLIGETPERDLFDVSLFGKVNYLGDVHEFINTPRDVLRIINTISVTFPAVKSMVYPPDFVTIEALRVFVPEAYEVIRRNKLLLTGSIAQPAHKQFLELMVNQFPENDELLRRILVGLFPKFTADYAPSSERIWREQKRICAPECFDNYFRFSILNNTLSQIELNILLSAGEDKKRMGDMLVAFAHQNPPRVGALLRKLRDNVQHVPMSNLRPMIEAFLDIGDSLINLEPPVAYRRYDSNRAELVQLLLKLLRRTDPNSHVNIIETGLKNGGANLVPLTLIFTIGQLNGKYGYVGFIDERDRVVTADDLPRLHPWVIAKIEKVVTAPDFVETRDFLDVVFMWLKIAPESAQAWLNTMLETPKQMAYFIRQFMTTLPNGEVIISDDIEHYMSLKALMERTKAMQADNKFTGQESAIARVFVDTVQKQFLG
ncbi:MAG: P-loop NTPase fold protein [bacterium]|nr:P-loop NTPase fold protein [bacterium]